MKHACELAAIVRLRALDVHEKKLAFVEHKTLAEVADQWKEAPLSEEREGWDRQAMVASAREALKKYSSAVVTMVYGAAVTEEASR